MNVSNEYYIQAIKILYTYKQRLSRIRAEKQIDQKTPKTNL